MTTAIALVLVITLGFVTSRLVKTLATRQLILSGAEYLVLGLIIGPMGLGVLTQDVLLNLTPFVSLLLGLLGFLLGLSLRRQLQWAALLEAGLLGSILALGIVFVTTFLILGALLPAAGTGALLWPALAIAAAAVVSDRSVVEVGSRLFGARGRVTNLLRSYALASSMVAVFVFGMGLAFARIYAENGNVGLVEIGWTVGSIFVGAACGLLFILFIGKEQDNQRTFLATVGVVIFSGGMAAGMGLSSLFVCAIAGFVVSLLSDQAEELETVLAQLGPPSYTILMIFAGAMWSFVGGWLLLMPLIYVALRVVAIRVASSLGTKAFKDAPHVPRVGNGLLAQGALAAAIALNFAQVNPEYGSLVMTTVFVGVIAGDLWGAKKLRETLADAGELGQVNLNCLTPPSEKTGGLS